MSEESLDEVRQGIAQMRTDVETALMVVELAAGENTPAYEEAKARALKALQGVAENIEELSVLMGGVPAPVRH